MKTRKYRLTEETKEWCGHTLHRIEALRDFSDVKAGDRGGFIESEENLSQDGNAWVSDNAKVYGNAWVCDNAQVSGNAWVYGNAWVCGNAEVYGNAWVGGNAKVSGKAEVCGYAEVCGNAKVCDNEGYIVFKNWWSSGRYFTWTRCNNMWKVGCFFGTGEELIKKAYADSEKSGREYERVVEYVESILADEKDEVLKNN